MERFAERCLAAVPRVGVGEAGRGVGVCQEDTVGCLHYGQEGGDRSQTSVASPSGFGVCLTAGEGETRHGGKKKPRRCPAQSGRVQW